MNLVDRILYVHDRLSEQCLDIGVVPQAMSKDEWDRADLVDPSNLHRRYGWVPPIVGGPDEHHPDGCACSACQEGRDPELIIQPFCPELIAEQSLEAELDDQHFAMYVDVLDYSVSMHIAHRDLPWEQREVMVDKALFDEAEDSMRLQNAVQMRILDGCTK